MFCLLAFNGINSEHDAMNSIGLMSINDIIADQNMAPMRTFLHGDGSNTVVKKGVMVSVTQDTNIRKAKRVDDVILPPTQRMLKEATLAGVYQHPFYEFEASLLLIYEIQDYFEGNHQSCLSPSALCYKKRKDHKCLKHNRALHFYVLVSICNRISNRKRKGSPFSLLLLSSSSKINSRTSELSTLRKYIFAK